MSIGEIVSTEEERVARSLIDEADRILRANKPDIPSGFLARLFARAAPEDLIGYVPQEIAALAESAWQFMATRRPGTPKIRFAPADGVGDGGRLKSISIVEIINDDMPFLLDSVMGELTDRGIAIRLVMHPVFAIERDGAGELTGLPVQPRSGGKVLHESFIYIHVDRVDDDIRRTETVQALEQVLAAVRVAVGDWRAMLARVGEIMVQIKSSPPPLPAGDVAETVQFLEWLVDNNFTFLGVREYVYDKNGALEALPETGLGVLRDPSVQELQSHQPRSMQEEMEELFQDPKTLVITKSDLRSPVHRRVAMDYIAIKRFDSAGHPSGEFRIVGLLTSTAYTRSVRSIPYLRRKVEALLERTGFDPHGHSGKALVNVLENYPRDELFRIHDDTLYEFALAILHLDERPRVRVLARRDRFDRFISALVYVPREHYDSRARKLIGEFLAAAYGGEVATFHPFFMEGPLVRVHFIIIRTAKEASEPDRATLEHGVGMIVRTWADALSEVLALTHETGQAQQLFERYHGAFSTGYQEHFAPSIAVEDIAVIEGLSSARPLSVDFHLRADDKPCVGLKVWSYNRPIPLSERVPVLENMGFRVVDERTYDIHPKHGSSAEIWLHDMMLERAEDSDAALDDLKPALEACFIMVMRGMAENDGYNALVLGAGLHWRDVTLIRAISRFLRQVRVPFSQDYMWATLRKHAAIAPKIVELFVARFDPRLDVSAGQRGDKQAAILADIETSLNAVESLDEDRILRRFVNAVRAAVRTNFYQLGSDGQPKPIITIKFASREIDDLPLPKPLYEIFVYSPRVEGVHLRFGKVARGGIRWSDRPQDFRTEILGLVKAQNVKNAVIVPVGSKGGFVPKLIPKNARRETVQAEGVATYKLFISTMLDITDTIGPSGVIPPDNVVRHDGDDPYLVVAADKGTATFSDIANGISSEHHFWLGDAFASGGSAGYDHKAMGITARGAWEAVKRHFREMDVDVTRTPFTVVGVGDMSGDVFGNGMLREKTTKLVAAFDHRDIFIDPEPDPEKSFAERTRLFVLPRSSWQDYDKALISKGGGVFSRSAKQIKLTPEIRTLLHLEGDAATPQQVMSAILKAPVDLLWFGGIGTYVRSFGEGDDAVGDRANDAIRITARDLCCKVIGEGANLGMTQRGRIEAALRGVRLDTDAIDNSAGVNTSDVEVNIKIALSLPLHEGRLTLEDRNKLLVEMTDDVAKLVLRNNYQQPLALSLAQRRGLEDLGFQQRLMQILEARGELDRAVEFLPDDMEIAERRRRSQPLTRPELAVLLAYAKLSLYGELLESPVPDDAYLGRELGRYFPRTLAERFPEALEKHRLRREIIATQLANSMINRGGPSLVVRIADQTGAPAAKIAAAFAAVRNSFDLIALNSEIDALDGKVSGNVQLDLYATVQDLLLDRLVWFIRNVDFAPGLAAVIGHYKDGIAAVDAALGGVLPEETAGARTERKAKLAEAGVPGVLSQRMANLVLLAAAPDIVLIADRTGRPIAEVTATYFAVGAYFRLGRVASGARAIEVSDYFDRLALDRARDQLGEAERRLTAEMVAGGASGSEAIDSWVGKRQADAERIRAAMHEIAMTGLTVSKVAVAANLLGDLTKR